MLPHRYSLSLYFPLYLFSLQQSIKVKFGRLRLGIYDIDAAFLKRDFQLIHVLQDGLQDQPYILGAAHAQHCLAHLLTSPAQYFLVAALGDVVDHHQNLAFQQRQQAREGRAVEVIRRRPARRRGGCR